jgi:rhodanese-related sulfurtransferase
MKLLSYYFGAPLLIALITTVLHPNKATFSEPEMGQWEISLSGIDQMVEPILWVDAREEDAFEMATIPNALNLSPGSFESNLPIFFENWNPGMTVLVFCDQQFCDSSHLVADRLREEIGVTEVFVLKGGWKAWNSGTN